MAFTWNFWHTVAQGAEYDVDFCNITHPIVELSNLYVQIVLKCGVTRTDWTSLPTCVIIRWTRNWLSITDRGWDFCLHSCVPHSACPCSWCPWTHSCTKVNWWRGSRFLRYMVGGVIGTGTDDTGATVDLLTGDRSQFNHLMFAIILRAVCCLARTKNVNGGWGGGWGVSEG